MAVAMLHSDMCRGPKEGETSEGKVVGGAL